MLVSHSNMIAKKIGVKGKRDNHDFWASAITSCRIVAPAVRENQAYDDKPKVCLHMQVAVIHIDTMMVRQPQLGSTTAEYYILRRAFPPDATKGLPIVGLGQPQMQNYGRSVRQ